MTSQSTATNFDNFTFSGNTVIGGYYALTLYGTSASPSTNVVVEDNVFQDFYYYGPRFYYTDGLSFQRNDITRANRTASSTMYGFYSFR